MTIIIYNLVGVQIPERRKHQSMTVRKIEIERLTIMSSRSFETVVAALEAAIGRPDMAEFMKATRSATTYVELPERGATERQRNRADAVHEARCRCCDAH